MLSDVERDTLIEYLANEQDLNDNNTAEEMLSKVKGIQPKVIAEESKRIDGWKVVEQ